MTRSEKKQSGFSISKARKFFHNYAHCFITGLIFTQPGWHDCYAFDAVRQLMGNGSEFVNLAKDLPHGTMHPQANAITGRYMQHLKGRRKDTGELEPGDVLPVIQKLH